MKQQYGEIITSATFGPFGYKWNTGDRVVLVMFDGTKVFGKFSQNDIIEALKNAPATVKIGMRNHAEFMAERVLQQLASDAGLKYRNCKATYAYQASVHNSSQRRHYVYVVGQDFIKMNQVGFKPFDHKGDLVAQLKEPDARVIRHILEKKFPSMSIFEDAA